MELEPKYRCYRCGLSKPAEDFVKNTARATGVANICKCCKRQYTKEIKKTEEYKKYSKEYYQKTKERDKEKRAFIGLKSSLKREGVSITKEQYGFLCDKQKGLCAICKKHEDVVGKLNLDHCHTSKKVRGLLCGPCNRALGMFKDNTSIVEKAISYLLTFKQ